MIFEGGGATEAGGDFFVFEIRIANFEDAKTVHEEFAFGNDVNFFTVGEKGAAGGAIGNGAVAEEFHRERRDCRRRRRWRREAAVRMIRIIRLRTRPLRWRRRGRGNGAEDIAAGAFVFGFAGLFQLVEMELRVLYGEQLRGRDRGAGISGNSGPALIEIEKPDGSRDQQEQGEHGELFFLLHEAVRKNVLRCSVTLMAFADAVVVFSVPRVKESTSYRFGERCKAFRKVITLR